MPLEPAPETSIWSPVWKQIRAFRGEMGKCPSDASGFRFYEEYDLEKATPISATATCPARVPWGSLLQTARLASTRRASADLWEPALG